MTVNELLVQMQSFDQPTTGQRLHGALVDAVNLLLPAHRRLRRSSNRSVALSSISVVDAVVFDPRRRVAAGGAW